MSQIIRDRIAARLKELGLSTGQASLDAGLSRSLLGKYVRGEVEQMREDRIEAVAAVLKCSMAYLRGETDEPGLPSAGDRDDAAATGEPAPVMSLVAVGTDRARIHVEGTVTFEAALAIMELFRKGQLGY